MVGFTFLTEKWLEVTLGRKEATDHKTILFILGRIRPTGLEEVSNEEGNLVSEGPQGISLKGSKGSF